jgi:CO/xanthine dehydrogenase FAD-binding subunit
MNLWQNYIRPTTLSEAMDAFAHVPRPLAPIAGGTDLPSLEISFILMVFYMLTIHSLVICAEKQKQVPRVLFIEGII